MYFLYIVWVHITFWRHASLTWVENIHANTYTCTHLQQWCTCHLNDELRWSSVQIQKTESENFDKLTIGIIQNNFFSYMKTHWHFAMNLNPIRTYRSPDSVESLLYHTVWEQMRCLHAELLLQRDLHSSWLISMVSWRPHQQVSLSLISYSFHICIFFFLNHLWNRYEHLVGGGGPVKTICSGYIWEVGYTP